MELLSDVADFKDTQDVDDPPPHQESLPIAKQEAHFMTKDPAKEFTVRSVKNNEMVLDVREDYFPTLLKQSI